MVFNKLLLFGLVFYLFTTCFASDLMAQNNAPIPQFTPIDPCTDPALPCPIDDGVYFLLAAGIGAAAYKTYRYKRVNTPSII